jgi:hypothetical protein
MTTRGAAGNLPEESGILRTAAQRNQVNVGVYASALHTGRIRRELPSAGVADRDGAGWEPAAGNRAGSRVERVGG